MRNLMVLLTLAGLCVSAFASAEGDPARYEWLKQLNGDWVLSPSSQEGKATRHKLVAPLVGTDRVAISYKMVGKGSTLQENILPGTGKEMATLYHCDNNDCHNLVATHYCSKQNQPKLVAAPAVKDNMLAFNCDMDTPLCRSGADHVHSVQLELSPDGNHLRQVFGIYKGGTHVKDSIYHFDRKTD